MEFNPQQLALLVALGLAASATGEQALTFYRSLPKEQRDRVDGLKTQTAPAPAPGTGGAASTGGADPAANPNPAPTPAATPETIHRDAITSERTRITAITQLGQEHRMPAQLVSRAISEGFTVDQASTAFLEHMRGARAGAVGTPAVPDRAPAAGGYQGTADERRLAMVSGIVMRGSRRDPARIPVRGVYDPVERTRIQNRAANMGERYEARSLMDYCRHALMIEGRDIPEDDHEMIVAAMATASLSYIFTDSVNAQLVADFMAAPDTTGLWTQSGEVSDFKVNTDITPVAINRPGRLGRGGTAQMLTFSDEGETFRAYRYAEQVVLDEQDIIDDMLGALTELPRAIGEDFAQIRQDLVYYILLSNPALLVDSTILFHADHGNLGTGAGTALASGTLSDGIEAMGKQRRNGRPLNVRPVALIVPHDLWFTANQLLNSTEVRSTEALATLGGQFGTSNPLKTRGIVPIEEDRIGVAGVTDPVTGTAQAGTASNWYLASNQRTIKVVHRRGTGGRPQIRQFMLDRGKWGMGWDCNLDIGAFARDFRGLYKAEGA